MNVDWEYTGSASDAWVDETFPAGRALLDTAAVADAVAGRPVPGGAVVADGPVALLNVYYHPGRTLQAVHRLAGGSVVTLDAVAPGAPAQAGRVAVAGQEAALRVFPDDPGLPTLAGVVAEAGGMPELLTHLPGRRCVLGTAERVGKLSEGPTVLAAHRRQLALWSAPGRRFRMARPLLLDEAGAVRWEERVAGTAVAGRLAEVGAARLADLVAGELAALHATPVTDGMLLAAAGPDRLLTRLERKTLRTLRRAVPAVAPRAEHVVSRLREAGPPACGPVTLVHGDFHLANLLLGADGAVVVDLDEVAVGDAELDLAQFVTRALLVALHTGRDLDVALDLAEALPAAYGETRGRAVDPADFGWYVAACLVARQAKTCVRHLAPDLDRLVGTLVDLAGDVLDRGGLDPGAVRAAAA